MIELSIKHSLADLDIDVHFVSEARCLALFGDSGAGKTTILNAIAGLLAPQRGRIVLDDQTLFDTNASINMPAASREIGYVFQDGRLFPHLSVRANLLYGAQARRRTTTRFDLLVELLELGPLLDRRPQNLSGGERQRVAIGRALASEPRILLLDEPLTGLHREARVQVLDHLRALKQELRIASLLVSHQADEVIALADEVIGLRAGAMTARWDIAAFSAQRA
ncbi:MAG TPA: ATP-binding cassette domain-containing protein [Dokdonella sp.]|uniref:ATP-binding cassette domain-containing protein n=1 Tax=Dokdonella sp. TaxID=2291710 RepID=UPI002D81077D|nr:ATP-binding cassette domain-containing protein [Dokdonella sp.]HET9031795.1 ATP-binding cassette domain-containing protein [Dokdonella sp.]